MADPALAEICEGCGIVSKSKREYGRILLDKRAQIGSDQPDLGANVIDSI